MIERDNYEAFFLDYYEGNLSPSQVKELYTFLDANPDLRETFEEYEHISLKDVEDELLHKKDFFGDKDILKREEVNADNIDEYIILLNDNSLSEKDNEQLERFLKKNPSFSPLKNEYKKTILTPDTAKVFSNKQDLKKVALEITKANEEDRLIEFSEGLLYGPHAVDFKTHLDLNPALQVDLKKLSATKLVADRSIVFPDKEILYNIPKRKRRGIFYFTAAAAGLVVFLLSYMLLNNSVNIDEGKQYSTAKPSEDIKITDTNSNKIENNINTAAADSKKIYNNKGVAKQKLLIAAAVDTVPQKSQDKFNTTIAINTVFPDSQAVVEEKPKSFNANSVAVYSEKKKQDSTIVTENQFVSVKDFFLNRIRANKKAKNNPDCEGEKNKLTMNDVIAMCSALVQKAGGSDVEIITQENACGEAVAVVVKANNWEFESPLVK